MFYKYLHGKLLRLLSILACCLIPYIGTSSKWKNEHYCRVIISAVTGREFISIRPNWLRNPVTGRNLELDCYNDELGLALEYNGKQHYTYTPSMHRSFSDFEQQVYRDEAKKALCIRNNVTLIIVPYTVPRYSLCSYILGKIVSIRKDR